ncbi:MAG: sulfur carrier protein ThiS [Betaproteobacteria bacterium]|nr:sulfur carrier protein ThiS [Betaproteobacteria bacterium]
MITLQVNGQALRVSAPITAAQLIEQLKLSGKRVALERNGEIVPKSLLPQQSLEDGDSLEIVAAVGGG